MKRKNIYYLVSAIIFVLTCIVILSITAVKADSGSENIVESTTISEAYIPSETTTKEETTTEVSTTEKVITTTREPSTEKQTTSPSVKVETTAPKATTTTEAENHPATTEPTTKKPMKDSDWEAKRAQYPYATDLWLYMKDLGWSDAVCAGIMGNIMAEVGGQTLNIKPSLSSGGYYGMCQWSTYYYPQINGGSFEAQCNFLRDTIQKEINTYGYKYASGMNYSKFLQLTSPADVALCFAKSYERCASGSYGVRQSNAQKAYNYFVG